MMNYLKRGAIRDEWMGTELELNQLADIQELAVCEYREELFKLLGREPIGNYVPSLGGPYLGQKEYQASRWISRVRHIMSSQWCLGVLIVLCAIGLAAGMTR